MLAKRYAARLHATCSSSAASSTAARRTLARRDEGRRADDVVSALARGRRRALRRRRGRARCARRGVEVEVVSPLVVPPLRDRLRPRRGRATCAGGRGSRCCCRAMLASFARAARRAPRGRRPRPRALAAGRARSPRATGKPFVVQLWGTDVELARRAPAARPARSCAARGSRSARRTSSPAAARELGARDVRVIPSGVDVPPRRSPSRTSRRTSSTPAGSRAEKGVLELVEAARGLPLVVAGDGPLRDRVPGALGLVAARRAARRSTSGRRSSSARRTARASASPAPRRWRTAGRSSPARSAGSATSSSTARPGLLVPPGDVAGAARRARAPARATPSCARRLGAAARAQRAPSTSRGTRAVSLTVTAYEDALPTALGYPRARAEGADDRRRPDRRRHRLLGHRRDRPQPPGLARAVQAALRGGGARAARTRSSSRSATTARCTRARSSTGRTRTRTATGRPTALHREALEFGRAEYQELKAYAAELGVTFFATAFDFKSAELLADLDMPAYKIASGDLTNTPLLQLRRRDRQADDRLHRRRHARRRPPRATTRSREINPQIAPAPVHGRLPGRAGRSSTCA